jgi:hypothetical protein
MNKNLIKYALIALGIYFITRKPETTEETSGNDTKDSATNGGGVVVAAPTKTPANTGVANPPSSPVVVTKPTTPPVVASKPVTPAVSQL